VYCAGKTSACLKRRFASSVLHSCNVKTQIFVTRPQCVKNIFIANVDVGLMASETSYSCPFASK